MNDQDATTDADTVMRAIVNARLSRGLTCVLDITGHPDDRAAYATLGHQHGARLTLAVFNVSLGVCLARQEPRGRVVPEDVIRAQLDETTAVHDSVLYLAGYGTGTHAARPDVRAWHTARTIGPLGQNWGRYTLPGRRPAVRRVLSPGAATRRLDELTGRVDAVVAYIGEHKRVPPARDPAHFQVRSTAVALLYGPKPAYLPTADWDQLRGRVRAALDAARAAR